MCDLIKILILQFRNKKLSSQSIQLGCPGSDMSLGKCNLKLGIGGLINNPQSKGELIHGRFWKKIQIEILYLVKKIFCFLELTIYSLLERNYV